MRSGKQGSYQREVKLEAVQLVKSDQTLATAARRRGVVEHTLSNWITLPCA